MVGENRGQCQYYNEAQTTKGVGESQCGMTADNTVMFCK